MALKAIEADFFSSELLTATFVANSASLSSGSAAAAVGRGHKELLKNRSVRCEPENWESTVTA